ncbi:MAG: WGR domain-containing protein [Cyanobacteriota bacterium]|nr:WGR domain-containing protein [Cyanobacteriota bacterium]
MKLIKKTTLHYQDDRSDKIYEVELCNLGEDRYIVNFRYGRRGGKLKEGTKTDAGVILPKAQQIFDKLVGEKVKKGYRDTSETPPRETSPPPQESSTQTIAKAELRKQAIMQHLEGTSNSEWSLDRVIWRAGELKIAEATPLLIELIGRGRPLKDYCIAWALGWCGGEGAIPALMELYKNSSSPEFVRRISFEALLKLSDEQTRAELQNEIAELLPAEIHNLVIQGSAESLTEAVNEHLENGKQNDFAILDRLYQINSENARSALLEILKTAPLQRNYFQRIRHIFKMAEYRRDAEVFGIIAYRFEKEPPAEWRLYSPKTREYLRRRVWNALKQLGEENNPDYIKMAVEILLKYADFDAVNPKSSNLSQWDSKTRRYNSIARKWDAYASYLSFGHILYENSPRYILLNNTKAWRCRSNYQPGDPEPKNREEAFPQLWDAHPEALVKLLLESHCRPVHHFAVKALKSNRKFCEQLDINTLIKLLEKAYGVTAEFAFELVGDRYDRANPNFQLVLGLANCLLSQGRQQAYSWIDAQRQIFLNNSNFIASLVTSKQQETRQFANSLLASSILNDDAAKVLIGQIIIQVLAFNPEAEGIGKIVDDIADTLLTNFSPQLRKLGMGVIVDLLQHPIVEVQELGAIMLLDRETPAAELPSELIESLIESPYEQVRGIGIRIFGQLPEETLISDRQLVILAMAVSSEEDIRNAVKPIIARLAAANSAFCLEFALDSIEFLLVPEKAEGIHSYLVALLRDDLPGWMKSIEKERAMELVRAKSNYAKEIGGLILQENSRDWAAEFETIKIVKLASNQILAVRQGAWQMFSENIEKFRSNTREMLAAVRILESKWDDSRDFAWKLFNETFTEADWSPEVTVSICDSVRDEVRQFGRELVTSYFEDSCGQDYLLKFSEHPSGDMQMFATNFLENYAADNPQKLRELMPYFVRVLSGVNRGGVAKRRVFAFLDKEAQKSKDSARVVAEILTGQSVTIAIGDKARAIQTMLKINKSFPDISLPITVKPVSEVRI